MAKKGLGETAPEGRNMRYIQRPYPTPKARAREHIAGHGTESPLIKQALMHKYSIGQLVYFEGAMQYDAARGQYKIVRLVPIERDNRVVYRIKNAAEVFERTAEEYQLKTGLG
ncbi:MAG: hypothetical protein WBV43_03155 [Pseudolabrys sp.]|jgi:hypothetical protein